MAETQYCPDWLEGYASGAYRWRQARNAKENIFSRRLGNVESFFDVDGFHFEGRADLNCHLVVELRSSKSHAALREHIALVWYVLRHEHALLSARAVTSAMYGNDRAFEYEQPLSTAEVMDGGKRHITYLEDSRQNIDIQDFYQHLMNSARAINPEQALSKLFVYPFSASKDGVFVVNFIFVLAHQITDGLTTFRWMSKFIDLLNLDTHELSSRADRLVKRSPLERLPPPQEELYHPISGNKARQRWFWAIVRVLRHVKHSPPVAFQNPLRRVEPFVEAKQFPAKYGALNYNRVPPLNSYAIEPTLGPRSTERLAKLCRQAKISIGSGLFTLVAIVMMQFEEDRNPEIAPENRLPFVGSFPVNPRPFLAGETTTGKEDSLMLAFSDGIVLPFLPKELPFEGRFRLLGRQAHRQLKTYQKRPRTAQEELSLGARNPRILLPSLYISSIERAEHWRRPEDKKGYNIQGAFPAATGGSLATCGISSVGDRTQIIASGKYDTSKLSPGENIVADFKHNSSTVRARDGEFLCGASSDRVNTYFMISVDSCAIDRRKAAEFKKVIESILEPDARNSSSKL